MVNRKSPRDNDMNGDKFFITDDKKSVRIKDKTEYLFGDVFYNFSIEQLKDIEYEKKLSAYKSKNIYDGMKIWLMENHPELII